MASMVSGNDNYGLVRDARVVNRLNDDSQGNVRFHERLNLLSRTPTELVAGGIRIRQMNEAEVRLAFDNISGGIPGDDPGKDSAFLLHFRFRHRRR